MQTTTIFVYDENEGERIIHCPIPTTHDEMWLYVLRVCLDMPDLQMDELQSTKDDLGDDIMDFNIVAVVPGYHESILDTLAK